MTPELSVCIPVHNRSRVILPDRRVLTPLPNLVRSLYAQAKAARLSIEIVIADFRSDDWPIRHWAAGCTVVDCDGPMSVGAGKNAAARSSRSDVLFFCDADMLLQTADVLTRGLEAARSGRAYFPRYLRYTGPDHASTSQGNGHGCCIVTRETWRTNPWLESTVYGVEDNAFAAAMRQLGLLVRDDPPGFYHQWHPVSEAKREAAAKRTPHGST